jgi:hypothetical protein
MADVDPGMFPDPRFMRSVAIAGINLFPSEGVVVKLEASHRELGSDQYRGENTVTLDVAFATDLFSR